MKIEIMYTTHVTFLFNDTYSMEMQNISLGDAINIAKTSMSVHDFYNAVLTDSDTGEVLCIIRD